MREAEPARRARREPHLLDRPGLALGGAAPHGLGREGVEGRVVGGVHGHELALQVRRQLSHGEPVRRDRAGHLVTVGLRLRCPREVEQALVPGRDLHAPVAEPGCPAADPVERVEGRGVAGELGQEQAGAFQGRRQGGGRRHRPRSATMRSATRQALAMMVSVGLAPVPVGKGEPSTQ